MTYTAFIDWNGTLLSDASASLECANICIRHFGGRALTIAEFREHFDIPLTAYYRFAGCDMKRIKEEAEQFYSIFQEEYAKREKYLRMRKGARALLQWLHQKKVHTVVLSNHDRTSIERTVQRLRMADFVTLISARDPCDHLAHARAKGQRAANYMQENRIKPERAVVIGDTIEEAHIASDLGAMSILVTGGFCSERRLRAHRPSHMVNHLGEAQRILSEKWFS